MKQTYNHFELLLIDDGSTDNSYEICFEMSKKDSRIKIFRQENSGVSQARNKGISEASGQFIIFIDSDDYIEEKMFKVLMNEYKEPKSLIVFGFYTHDIENGISYLENTGNQKPTTLTLPELSINFWKYYVYGLTNSPCNKLYMASIIKENNIKFPPGIKMGEDIVFNLNYFQHIKELNIINEYLYNYMQYPEQSTKKVNLSISEDMLFFLTRIENFIITHYPKDSQSIDLIEHNYQIFKHLKTALSMPYRSNDMTEAEQKKYLDSVIKKFNDTFPNRVVNGRSLYESLTLYLIKNRQYNFLHYLLKFRNLNF